MVRQIFITNGLTELWYGETNPHYQQFGQALTILITNGLTELLYGETNAHMGGLSSGIVRLILIVNGLKCIYDTAINDKGSSPENS